MWFRHKSVFAKLNFAMAPVLILMMALMITHQSAMAAGPQGTMGGLRGISQLEGLMLKMALEKMSKRQSKDAASEPAKPSVKAAPIDVVLSARLMGVARLEPRHAGAESNVRGAAEVALP